MKESIPEKRIFPGAENPEVTNRKYQGIIDVLDGVYDGIPESKRQTIMDFPGLNPEAKDKDFLRWIERELEIDPIYILQNAETPESKKIYLLLNHAYLKARDFLYYTLKYEQEELPREPKSIRNKEDAFAILDKTVLGRGETHGLSRAVMYCRLVKATVATYESLKNDARALEILTKDFEESLVSSNPDTVENSPLLVRGENQGEIKFYVKDQDDLEGSLETRAKKLPSILLRFINRPESNAATALADGIASRITIEEEKSVELVPVIYKWLIEKKKVEFVTVENANYLSTEQQERLLKKMAEILPRKQFSFQNEKPNDASMGEFATLKIKGRMLEYTSVSRHAQQFEIQLVIPGNKNEEGKMHHSVYDAMKLVSARTRLDGGCPAHVFNKFIEEASRDSGMSEEEIKKYLLEAKDAPIVKIKRRNGDTFYVASSVYKRWNGFGWVDDRIIEEIEAARS